MTYKKWKQIVDEGYSSDAVSLLQFIENEEELDDEHAKTQSILSLLNRKQLVVEGKLTELGKALLKDIDIEEIALPKVKKTEAFEEWWKIYPSTDAFEYQGKMFPGVQSKKKDKSKCKEHFNRAVNEGIAAQDIISATVHHIEQAKKLSLSKGSSQISYIPGSEIYLRNRVYEPFIELSKKKAVTQEMANPNKLWN